MSLSGYCELFEQINWLLLTQNSNQQTGKKRDEMMLIINPD